jgi:hypothetical protein
MRSSTSVSRKRRLRGTLRVGRRGRGWLSFERTPLTNPQLDTTLVKALARLVLTGDPGGHPGLATGFEQRDEPLPAGWEEQRNCLSR